MIDIGFAEPSLFFTDGIKSDKSFINVIKSVASKWGHLSKLHSRYLEQSVYRKSNLKTQLHDINIKCNELLNQLNKLSETRPKPNMNASLLSQTYLQKAQIFKEIVVTLGHLNTKICDGDILFNLSERIKQQNATMNSKNVDHEQFDLMCSSNSDFKWDNTFNILLESENSGMKLNNFSTHELTKFACILSENIVTNIKELELTKLDKATIEAILQIIPVMFLNLGQTSVFINMQEFVYVPNSIEALLVYVPN